MRSFIIVSIQDEKKELNYDIEVPTNIPAVQLAEDIVEALNNYNPRHFLPNRKYTLYCVRQKRLLEDRKSLMEAGVWTGDVLILK